MKKGVFAGLFLAALLAAAVFRLRDLGLRPMHHDEANQALKFGALLENGEYRYDKNDHHGPSLYYFSLPFARISSPKTLAGMSEAALRRVTAAFGIGAVLLLPLLVPFLGRRAVCAAALLLAVSPAMVYFSRFYIQETLLVFFLLAFLASVWRYVRRPGAGWAAAAGVFAGLMYATKETAVIAFGSTAGALLLTFLISGAGATRKAMFPKTSPHIADLEDEIHQAAKDGESRTHPGPTNRLRRARWGHLILALAVAVAVSFLLFSSILKNPGGFWDSILSFKIYFTRAGEGGFHVHPWHYYLQTLVFSRPKAGPFWSEGLILVLALAGCVAAFRARPAGGAESSFPKFLVFYTALSTAVYSLIAYKTPWNALPFYIGFILLAGAGLRVILAACRGLFFRLTVALLVAAAFLHLGIQACRANFVYPADPRNPYVYAQTTPDFLKLVGRVEEIASHCPEFRGLLIKVIAGPYETWPLPWYLRSYSRVGYWTSAEDAGEIGLPELIISSTDEGGRLDETIYTMYRSEFYELRPGVFLMLHVRNDIWESVFPTGSDSSGEIRG